MSTAPIAASLRPRRTARVAVLLAASIALHALALHGARDEFDVAPAPAPRTIQVELFRLPAPVAVTARAVAPRRSPRAITPPAAVASAPAAEPPAMVAPEPAPTASPEPAADALPEPGGESLAAAPANALPQEPAPLEAVLVGFPRVGRFVSDTIYRKGLLELRGTTTIEWRIGGAAYEASSVTVDADGRTLLTLASHGAVRPDVGIAPERYTEQRHGRAPQAVNFQWPAGIVSFSASSAVHPLQPGVQDQLSFMAQLALLAQAFPERFQPGMPVALEVAGTRHVRVYDFTVVGWQTLDLAGARSEALKLERVVAPGAREARIALWLAPSLRWLPARTRTVLPNEDVVETVLKDVWFIE